MCIRSFCIQVCNKNVEKGMTVSPDICHFLLKQINKPNPDNSSKQIKKDPERSK